MLDFEIVVAVDEEGGIGRAGAIPWRLAGDLAHFRAITTARSTPLQTAPNAVVMGRKTWDSLPARFRPLPGRLNLVVSGNERLALPGDVRRASGLEPALVLLAEQQARAAIDQCFVIGGAAIYRQALASSGCRRVHLTRVAGRFDCDLFLAALPAALVLTDQSPTQEEGGLRYWFERWDREPTGPTALRATRDG